MAVVLANTPNTFPGLLTIGKIFYILNLVLFVLFTTAMGLRAFWTPRRFLASLHHPIEGLFFGAFWVSVSLILNGAQAYGMQQVPQAVWSPSAFGAGYGYTNKSTPQVGDKTAAMAFANASPVGGDYRYSGQQYGYGHGHGHALHSPHAAHQPHPQVDSSAFLPIDHHSDAATARLLVHLRN